MSYAELLNLYFDRSNALQWYWTLYVVIIGGLLAFSSMRAKPDLITTAIVSVLFLAFAYKNMGAIVESTNQRIAVLQLLNERKAESDTAKAVADKVLPTLQPAQPDAIRRFHLTCDVLTVAGLWAIEYRRRRLAKAEARP